MGQMKNVEAIIENKLYLGNVIAARATRTLTERRITHILSVCNDAIPAEVPESGICHKRISIEDVEYADLLIHLPAACHFIHQALASGGTILVHSVNGISRSAAVVVAYFMWSRRLGATDATEIVRRARDSIWINPGFQEQLVLFQVCQYNPHPGDGVYASWKTKVERKLKAAGLR
ncbi:phosphatases II [Macrolepiota fuliginosa MF-IS2]|uniref:Phosphatases II n=1 Tax=Macrolepiota fuliginosa MF-IS2 TaxID=1400762 RepID=A0A9P5XLR3_9AGAR|nr:phosphatases II [Macrolepiota fuliginosa MF-IS2]